MRNFWEWLLDEKIVLCLMAFTFAVMALILVFYDAEKEYIMTLFGLSNMLVGALLRGITHQISLTDQASTDQTPTNQNDQNGGK